MLPGLVLERPLFRRERADGLFLPATYLAHKLSEEVPGMLVSSPSTRILCLMYSSCTQHCC